MEPTNSTPAQREEALKLRRLQQYWLEGGRPLDLEDRTFENWWYVCVLRRQLPAMKSENDEPPWLWLRTAADQEWVLVVEGKETMAEATIKTRHLARELGLF